MSVLGGAENKRQQLFATKILLVEHKRRLEKFQKKKNCFLFEVEIEASFEKNAKKIIMQIFFTLILGFVGVMWRSKWQNTFSSFFFK